MNIDGTITSRPDGHISNARARYSSPACTIFRVAISEKRERERKLFNSRPGAVSTKNKTLARREKGSLSSHSSVWLNVAHLHEYSIRIPTAACYDDEEDTRYSFHRHATVRPVSNGIIIVRPKKHWQQFIWLDPPHDLCGFCFSLPGKKMNFTFENVTKLSALMISRWP